ncbi:MAG TPA: methyltransferase [Polyangiaceae bacterium]|nr:methyltransferase [Polyangiaceae bacterium]
MSIQKTTRENPQPIDSAVRPALAPPPDAQLLRLILGSFVSRALAVAAELNVADLLQDGPLSVKDLAERTHSNPDGLYRTLRALAAVGVFEARAEQCFANNEVSTFLRADVPGSLRANARWFSDVSGWTAWGRFDHSVRTGKPAFEEVFGTDCFTWLQSHPSSLEIFQQTMTELSAASGSAVASAYDFSSVRTLVDVGGGHGALLSLIIDHFPGLKGVLFDRHEVIQSAGDVLKAGGHAGEIEVVAGDFFEAVPAGADAYIMKLIIHDWDDEHCVRLLSNCRRAMAPRGRVLIVDFVLSDGPESTLTKLIDLEMLVLTHGGRERTVQEYSSLLASAGLELARLIPTQSPVSVIEAFAS